MSQYTFPALLVETDDAWNATSLMASVVTLKLDSDGPFSYSYGDSVTFAGGEVFRVSLEQGTIYDEISFVGYNESFTAYTPFISQFTNTNDEEYVVLEFVGRLNDGNFNALTILYAEGDHFNNMTTLDDWYLDANRKSQGEVTLSAFEPGALIDFSTFDTGNSALISPTSQLTVIAYLFGEPLLLENLTEVITVNSHTIEYNGTKFNYDDVDPFITTVVRDRQFTDEFAIEIADAYPSVAGITYEVAVGLVGAANLGEVMISVAGMDGNYVA